MYGLIKYRHIVYLFFLITFMFTNPLHTDEAWVASTLDNIETRHNLSWTILNVDITFGRFYFVLESKIFQLFNNYISLRLTSALFFLLGLYYIYKITYKIFNSTRLAYLSTLFYFMFGVPTGILLNARTESLYVASISAVLYYVYLYFENRKCNYLYISTLFSSLAAITHPNGILLFLFLLIVAVQDYRSGNRLNVKCILANTVLAVSLLYMGLLYGTSIDTFTASFLKIANDTGHSIPFYFEYKRYYQFFREYPYLILFYLFAIYGLISMYRLIDSHRNNLFFIFFYFCFLLVLMYLTIIGVKWEYYLSLEFPFIIIALVYFVKQININIDHLSFLLVGILLTIDFNNIPKNEEMFRILNINSSRLNIINDVIRKTKRKSVVAPIQTYFVFRGNARLFPFEKFQYTTLIPHTDYVVLNILIDKEEIEHKINHKLKYIQSFVYNESQFNLFRIK